MRAFKDVAALTPSEVDAAIWYTIRLLAQAFGMTGEAGYPKIVCVEVRSDLGDPHDLRFDVAVAPGILVPVVFDAQLYGRPLAGYEAYLAMDVLVSVEAVLDDIDKVKAERDAHFRRLRDADHSEAAEAPAPGTDVLRSGEARKAKHPAFFLANLHDVLSKQPARRRSDGQADLDQYLLSLCFKRHMARQAARRRE